MTRGPNLVGRTQGWRGGGAEGAESPFPKNSQNGLRQPQGLELDFEYCDNVTLFFQQVALGESEMFIGLHQQKGPCPEAALVYPGTAKGIPELKSDTRGRSVGTPPGWS